MSPPVARRRLLVHRLPVSARYTSVEIVADGVLDVAGITVDLKEIFPVR